MQLIKYTYKRTDTNTVEWGTKFCKDLNTFTKTKVYRELRKLKNQNKISIFGYEYASNDKFYTKFAKMNKIIIENVKKALYYQSVDELINTVNQLGYRSRLYDYFERLLKEGVTVDFNNPDIRHDIHGLKQKDEHFLTRL